MSFAIQARLLPSVSSYDEALTLYEKSFSGSDNWRRLKKRDASKLICKTDDGRVLFRYHHTVLVEWVGQGHIVLNLYDSVSSHIFMNAFLPYGVYAHSIHGSMHICVPGKGVYSSTKPLEFKRTDGAWILQNPDTVIRHTKIAYDAKVAAAIRKKVKPFIEDCRALMRIRQERIPAWRINSNCLSLDSIETLDKVIKGEEVSLSDVAQYHELSLTTTMQHAYVLGGAVKREVLPLGSVPPRKNKYEYLNTWPYALAPL